METEDSSVGREQSLLDRIAAATPERASGRYEATKEEDAEALMESVQRNLIRLLNARHGMSEAAPDYGLPALTDMLAGSEEYLRQVQDAIRVAIERYEPRLRRVRVTHKTEEGDERMLVFRIDAVLVGRSGEHRVWYETSFSPTGKFQVAG
ncbi:MAG: type VI secretion system baseplate subunit TssE [Phycisphaerae bacterium]|nr:type VI secretion system baseplate subunit TssE [Phycisphaerae bacterium]